MEYKQVISDDFTYKGCDYVTVDIFDDEDFAGAKIIGTGSWSYFAWNIPAGSYTEDYAYDHPAIITVEVVTGNAMVTKDVVIIQYLNGVKNQYSTMKSIPVLGYSSKRAGSSHVVRGAGELIVNEKPTVLRLRVLQSDSSEIQVAQLNSLVITLKYSYYVKKPSRIAPVPPNRYM